MVGYMLRENLGGHISKEMTGFSEGSGLIC